MRKVGRKNSGFTLVEALVGTAVFIVIALSVYQAYTATMNVIRNSRTGITATALANEQFEIMRNLPYAKVGILGGLPAGQVPALQTLVRNNQTFTVQTTIRNIDDPFDGQIGSSTNDTSPADYKLAEVEISCPACRNFSPIRVATHIAPKNLESASTNGALFVKVFDSIGQPVPGASVHIENDQASPAFSIDDTTNNDGVLEIVDAPPGISAYRIIVTKDGYTTDRTYTIGDPENPNPSKVDSTVLAQQLTEISFFIDQESRLDITSVTETCETVPGINFSLRGSKLIGTEPDTYKYSENLTTENDGTISVSSLDWDTYSLAFGTNDYDLSGLIPSGNFTLNPGSVQDVKIIVAPTSTKSLLVTVKDAVTGLPLPDAEVTLTGANYDNTRITGRGFLRQTDWSNGAGQENFSDPARFSDSDGNLEIADPAGLITLKKTLGNYADSGWLISSTFDTGSASQFGQILWQTVDQPIGTGADSVRFQIATNNDRAVWNFLGPDGTNGTYYTPADQNIGSDHDGDRYLRYKVFLQTAAPAETPTISDVLFTFTSACVPPGQVLFAGLPDNNYDLSVTKDGYQSYSGSVNANQAWQEAIVTLTP